MMEQGIEILGSRLGNERFSLIDLVALDKQGRVLLIQADVQSDQRLLFSIQAQKDWFSKNRTLIRRAFPDLSHQEWDIPLTVLILPECPSLLREFVRATPDLSLRIYEYRCFETSGQRFLHLEPVPPEEKSPESEDARDFPPFRTGNRKKSVSITPEERRAFLS